MTFYTVLGLTSIYIPFITNLIQMRAPKPHGASGYPTGQSSSTALKEMLREIFAFSKWTEFKRGLMLPA